MERTTFNILFFVKKSKLLKDGTAPIYVRITVNGESCEAGIKRSINPSLWDVKRNKVKAAANGASEINDFLNSIQGQVFKHHQLMQENGADITARILMDKYLGKQEKTVTLVQLFKDHNENMKQLIGIDYAKTTYVRYGSTLKHISAFLKKEYCTNDVSLRSINLELLNRFEFYLKKEAECIHNSAMKHMKSLKKVVNLALAHGHISKDPFLGYKITQKEVSRAILTESELKDIRDKEIDIPRLAIVRDMFVFQCYTGIAFHDLTQLTTDNIVMGINHKKWIHFKRQKTGAECRLLLLDPALMVLEKYHGLPTRSGKLFPIPSNQKFNAYLKEIATICGIKKNISSHTGRHTFSTTIALSNGVPMETLQKLLGHKQIATTQVYGKILDNKISDEMDSLNKKLG